MPWNTADETFIAGTGQLYAAPVGTTLPAPNTDPTAALNGAFVGTGYTAEDGASFKGELEVTGHRVWQSTSDVRRERKSQTFQIGCELVQWNEITLPLAFGGGSVDTSGGFPTYTFPVAGESLYERAVVLDVTDGDRHMRIVMPRMNIADSVESQFNADNMANLAIVLSSLASTVAPYVISDDAAAFATNS